MNSTQRFVLDLIEKDAPIPEGISLESFNYIDTGYVDSIGVIKFVVDIETRFDIEISDMELESAEFRTVGGVVSMINRKLANAGSEEN